MISSTLRFICVIKPSSLVFSDCTCFASSSACAWFDVQAGTIGRANDCPLGFLCDVLDGALCYSDGPEWELAEDEDPGKTRGLLLLAELKMERLRVRAKRSNRRWVGKKNTLSVGFTGIAFHV